MSSGSRGSGRSAAASAGRSASPLPRSGAVDEEPQERTDDPMDDLASGAATRDSCHPVISVAMSTIRSPQYVSGSASRRNRRGRGSRRTQAAMSRVLDPELALRAEFRDHPRRTRSRRSRSARGRAAGWPATTGPAPGPRSRPRRPGRCRSVLPASWMARARASGTVPNRLPTMKAPTSEPAQPRQTAATSRTPVSPRSAARATPWASMTLITIRPTAATPKSRIARVVSLEPPGTGRRRARGHRPAGRRPAHRAWRSRP